MNDITINKGKIVFNYRAGIIFIKNNMILIEIIPSFDFIGLPGGRLKMGEDSLKCIIREIKEEMNFNLNEKNIFLNGVIEHIFTKDNKKYHVLHFIYKYKNNKVKFNDLTNHDSKDSYYKWVSIDKLNQISLLPKGIIDIINNENFVNIIEN